MEMDGMCADDTVTSNNISMFYKARLRRAKLRCSSVRYIQQCGHIT